MNKYQAFISGVLNETVTLVSQKKVKDVDGTHVEVKLSNGKTYRLVKLSSRESMGVPGWHDMDVDQYSFRGDSVEDAIKQILSKAK